MEGGRAQTDTDGHGRRRRDGTNGTNDGENDGDRQTRRERSGGRGVRVEELVEFFAGLEGGVNEGGVAAAGFQEFAQGIGIGGAAFQELEKRGGCGLFDKVVADRIIEDIRAEGIELLPDCINIRRTLVQFLQELPSARGMFQASVETLLNFLPGGIQGS